jgi:hypothetical protein
MLFFYLIKLAISLNLYLFKNDSYTINPYDYFSGPNLNLSSPCENVKILQGFTISPQSSYNYTNYSENNPEVSFPQLLSFYFDEKVTIIDYKGTTIFIFSFNVSTSSLELNSSLTTDFPIIGINLWTSKRDSRLIVLCQSQINYIYSLRLLDSTFVLDQIPMWDLRYLKNLQSCEVDNSSFIPFIGNYDENSALVFLYKLDKDLDAVFIMSFNLMIGNIVDVSFQDFRNGTLEIYSLVQNVGVSKIVFNYQNFSSKFDFLPLETNFTTIQLVWNSFYNSVIDSKVLSVGGINGSYFIQSNNLNIMFFLEGSLGYLMTGASSFDNLLLTVSEDRSFYIFNDSVSTRLKVVQNNFSEIIESFFESKWFFFQSNFDDILMIVSNKNSLETFILDYELASATLFMEEENCTCEITSNLNKTIFFELNLIEDTDLIYYLNLDEMTAQKVIFLEILFEGFNKNFYVDPYLILSGRNMSFELNSLNFQNQIFDLTQFSFEKLSKIINNETTDHIDQALIYGKRIYLVSKNVIMECVYEKNYLFSIKTEEFDEIYSVASGSLGLLTSYRNDTNFLISLKDPNEIIWEIPFICEKLKTLNSYIVCYTQNSITILNITASKELKILRSINTTLTIIDLCIFNETNNHHILLINSNFSIILISIEFPNPINGSFLLTLENSYKIIANYPNFFVFTPGVLQIFMYLNFTIREIDLPDGNLEIFSLNNFLYCSQNNHLIILDGPRSKLNIYFLDILLESSCKVIGADFYDSDPWLFTSCSEENSKNLQVFKSSCPKIGSLYPCNFLLPLDVNISNYTGMTSGEYSYNFSINAKNERDVKSFDVVLKLIVYGQVVQMANEVYLKMFQKMNYDRMVSGDLMMMFSGNNMEFELVVKNSENKTIKSGYPLTLTQRINVTYNYSDDSIVIYSLTSIPYKDALIFSNNISVLSFLNTSSTEVFQLNFSNVKNFSGFICPTVKFLFFVDPSVHLLAVCSQILTEGSMYMNGMFRVVETNQIFYLVFMKFNFHSLEVDENIIFIKLDYRPYALNLAYQGSSSVFVMLISHIQITPSYKYLNNEVRVINMTLKNNFLYKQNDTHINFKRLGLDKFFATSIDGFFGDRLNVAIVDRYRGMVLLELFEDKIIERALIEHRVDDPFISVGFNYKTLNLVTSDAKIIYYKFNQLLNLTYYVTRYPYTLHKMSIFTVPSKISYDSFYFNKFLVFPVTYNYSYYYFRIIDNSVKFSSSIIKDIRFTRPHINNFNFHVEFVDTQTAFFVCSSHQICKINLSDPYISKFKMTKNDFQELKKQKNEKFSFQIIAKNGNNKCLTQEMDSEILGYEVSSDHQTSLQIWVIPVISVILIIVLTVTSVLVYRCIILKRRNLINLTELIEHRELHQVFSVEGRYYK